MPNSWNGFETYTPCLNIQCARGAGRQSFGMGGDIYMGRSLDPRSAVQASSPLLIRC